MFSGLPHLVLTTPSEWLKAQVESSFLGQYPVYALPNGIDTDAFAPCADEAFLRNAAHYYGLDEAEGRHLVLSVASTWEPRKGLEDLLELAEKLGPEYCVAAVGLDEYQIRSLPEKSVLGIPRTGNLNDLCALYTAADLCVSLSHAETMGMTLVEALACGTQVLCWDVTAMPEFRRAQYIGRVFQDPMMGTAANMQIEENLALAARRGKKRTLRWGVTNAEREEYHERLKTLGLGLEDRMTAKVGLLSGGQRQALTLLMASLQKPKLLLLDEHTAALDPATAAKVLELSDRIVRENELTAMMITHNMKDAIVHGNRLIMMNEGRIILDIEGEEKQHLTKRDLLDKFAEVAGMQVESDEVLLS